MKKFAKPRKYQESNIILVSNIPAPKNAISRIYNYFKRYGHINSLWVKGTEAQISYDSVSSARKALTDPMSLMNNRFIKLQYVTSPNKTKTNLRQYIDNERVDNFANEVNDNIQNLIQKTENLKKELLEQSKQKIQQANIKQDIVKAMKDKDENVVKQKKEKDNDTSRKINDLQKQKTELIIKLSKAASNRSDINNDEIQAYKDQIEEIQAKIDLYAYEGSQNYVENDENNLIDSDNPNNENNDEDLQYEEVNDVVFEDEKEDNVSNQEEE